MGERTEAIGGTPTGGATSASAASADAASTHATSARSFDAAADVYEASRPDYPSAAVDWMVPAGARRALDVGAGTGKLTRALVDRGLEVTAADPSAPMLEVLRRVVPKARAIVAGAEHLPLDDASVDVVTVAQAWHWVDPLAASAEAARVLAPGGTIALVWNIRDETADWLRRFGEIAGSERSFRDLGQAPVVGPGFAPLERAVFPWSRTMTRDDVLDLVRSRSWYLTADEASKDTMMREIGTLVDDALVGGVVEMAYITEVFRARLL
jgi:SAM-dependent methyltransferase